MSNKKKKKINDLMSNNSTLNNNGLNSHAPSSDSNNKVNSNSSNNNNALNNTNSSDVISDFLPFNKGRNNKRNNLITLDNGNSNAHSISLTSTDNVGSALKRSDIPSSTFASVLVLTPLDRSTGRKHVPFITNSKRINVCGSSDSTINLAFKSGISELLSSPKWLSNDSTIRGTFSVEFLTVYFNFVSEILGIITISNSILCLYDDYQDNELFRDDLVMTSILNDYFGGFIPRRKQFTSCLKKVENLISKFFLPPELVDAVCNHFKFTSLPYHGFETMVITTLLISIPEGLFERNGLDILSGKDKVISFPFDESIVNGSSTYNNTLRILEHYAQSLENSTSYNGEFNDVHSLFRKAIPEWSVNINSSSDFVYTRIMSEAERISLLNENSPIMLPAVPNKLTYDQFIGGVSLKKTTSVMKSVGFGNVHDSPGFIALDASVYIDDTNLTYGQKPVRVRNYTSIPIWHDSNGGFKLDSSEMVLFNFPVKVENNINLTPESKITNKVINEPGLVYNVSDSSGLTCTYAFTSKLRLNKTSAINVISKEVNKSIATDYFSAISRRSGHLYDLGELPSGANSSNEEIFKNKDKIQFEPLFMSHPTLRRVNIDLNSLTREIYEKYLDIWTSKTCVDLHSKQNAYDARSEYKQYEVINVTKEVS